MARTDTLGHFLTDVADAIREKKGSVDTIAAEDFDTEIENLPSGGGRNWSAIGYAGEPPAIQEGYDNAVVFANNWDSSITNGYRLFYTNNTLRYLPKVDMTNITNVYQMFYLAYSMLYVDIDIPNATSVSSLFENCYSLQYAKVKTSNKITSTQSMCYTCYALREIDISEMDMTNVTSMNRMFCLTPSLKSIDFSAVTTTTALTSMYQMFNACSAKTITFGEHIDTSNVTTMNAMFANCNDLETINGLNYFDTRKVTNMAGMFQTNYNIPGHITSLDLSSFETPALTNAENMFAYRSALVHIDMRNFDFSTVTSFSAMFGQNASAGVPDDCEIIVADATQKAWVTTNFSRLTNVKTVAEYEAE